MAENGKEQQSMIIVTFAALGSAEFNIQVQNATPAQILSAAEYLRLMAERQIVEGWTQQALQRAQQTHEMAQVQQMIRGKPS